MPRTTLGWTPLVRFAHLRRRAIHFASRRHTMTERSTPPFRADHVGSFLRPGFCSTRASSSS
jgi:hypothetical protein